MMTNQVLAIMFTNNILNIILVSLNSLFRLKLATKASISNSDMVLD